MAIDTESCSAEELLRWAARSDYRMAKFAWCMLRDGAIRNSERIEHYAERERELNTRAKTAVSRRANDVCLECEDNGWHCTPLFVEHNPMEVARAYAELTGDPSNEPQVLQEFIRQLKVAAADLARCRARERSRSLRPDADYEAVLWLAALCAADTLDGGVAIPISVFNKAVHEAGLSLSTASVSKWRPE